MFPYKGSYWNSLPHLRIKKSGTNGRNSWTTIIEGCNESLENQATSPGKRNRRGSGPSRGGKGTQTRWTSMQWQSTNEPKWWRRSYALDAENPVIWTETAQTGGSQPLPPPQRRWKPRNCTPTFAPSPRFWMKRKKRSFIKRRKKRVFKLEGCVDVTFSSYRHFFCRSNRIKCIIYSNFDWTCRKKNRRNDGPHWQWGWWKIYRPKLR